MIFQLFADITAHISDIPVNIADNPAKIAGILPISLLRSPLFPVTLQ
jgi:hypothetical protein